LNSDIETTAATIRTALGFDLEERRKMPTWTDALRRLIQQADALGILVMVNGVVGNNNYRRLDPDEFRGFALADDVAPLVFINGADAKAAQMFTFAHEMAHLWLGQTALSDVGPVTAPIHGVERWCSQIAAELLVPLAVLRAEYQPSEDLRRALDRLARGGDRVHIGGVTPSLP
jgi:Zn-dependent peptidase ImmA (M78 family)